MDINPDHIKSGRQAILKDVFEDNLRIAGKLKAAPRRATQPTSKPARSWQGWGFLLLFTSFVVFGGVQFYREMTAPPPVEPVQTRSAAARFEQEFGTTFDPGENAEMGIANLFGLQVKTLVLDAGHGGTDPGASGPTGLQEKDITLDVARRLKRRLERDYGFIVLMTREDDRKVSLRERIAYANDHEADLFVSLHVNALPVDTVTSVETYYFSPQADAQTLRLAAIENKESDYSMAEFQNTIEKMGNTMKFQESKHLAVSIQRALYRNMHRMNRQVSDWGARSGPFMVLLGVEVPSILAEISVISNKAEEAKLYTPDYREQLATFLTEGIVDYLRLQPTETTEKVTTYGSEKDSNLLQ